MEELNELEELRLRIAIKLGYRVATFGEGYATLFPPDETLPDGAEILDLVDYLDSVPDWPNDIAAACELEDEIPNDQRYPYIRELVLIVAPSGNFYKLTEIYWRLTHATPEQRCHAWLAWMEAGRADIIT
jgi:hypothetical protein